MKTKTMTLPAVTPEYLVAKADTAEARKGLRDAVFTRDKMISQNEKHAADLADIRARAPGVAILTNSQAEMSEGRREVAYGRCRHVDAMECDHVATDPIYTADDVAAADQGITDADLALRRAETKLTTLEPSASFDAAAQGVRFLWWPQDKFTDPRLRRYRGQPITADELAALGPHELLRLTNTGAVIDTETGP